jgi:signal transduction histidine kinase/DNA-binding response OmpR family regulator/ligand-binding sensor domain-containing protein
VGAQEHAVKFLDIRNGLPSNSVMVANQDKQGFMWFGTMAGLCRYDGYAFTTYHNRIGDKKSLVSNVIYSITPGHKGDIWVGGSRGGSVFNTVRQEFEQLTYIRNGKSLPLNIGIGGIKVTKESVLIATGEGLFLFKGTSRKGKIIPFNQSANKTLYNVSEVSDKDVSGNRWVNVSGYGLCRFNDVSNELSLYYRTALYIKCSVNLPDGNLWLGTNEGLYYFDVKKHQLSANLFSSKTDVTDILRDKDGRILVTTDGGEAGLYEITANKSLTPYYPGNNPDNITSNVFYDVYEDNHGNKWYTTLRGGVIMEEPNPKDFQTIKYNKSSIHPVDDYIFSFCEDSRHNLWIGTDGAGLRHWNRKTNTYTVYSKSRQGPFHIANDFIPSVTEDIHGNIWFATWGAGVNRIDKNGNIKKYSCYNPLSQRAEDNIWIVFKNPDNTIWACPSNPGWLYRFNPEKDRFEVFSKEIANIQCIVSTTDGLWAGNFNTLIHVDVTGHKHTFYDIGYTVRSIYEDRKKQLWVGTEDGGLLKFDRDKGTFTRISIDDGLPFNTVLNILEDENGNLWMSTFNGLSKFDPGKKTFRNFTIADGLQSNQFNFNAALKLSTGEFAFGGINGFNLFYPNRIASAYGAYPVLLCGFKINNEATGTALQQQQNIKLPYDQTTLSFDFLALDYNNSERINYAYQLVGWDDHWVVSGKGRTANYTKLPEGNYTFKVKASNLTGGWNAPASLLHFTVLPPWYRSWWAFVLYVLGTASVIVGFMWYYKSRQDLKLSVRLTQLERTREKELTEKQLSLFTNISHEFRTPLSLIINPLKKLVQYNDDYESGSPAKAQLAVAYRNARRLLSLVDQLLLFRKAEGNADALHLSEVDLIAICREVFYCFTNQAAEKNIAYHFNHPEDMETITADYEKLEIALFNLMSNAFKFTPAGGSITLTLAETIHETTVTITDTGSGIPQDEQQYVFEKFRRSGSASFSSGFGIGLYIVKHFIEKHKGGISFTSTPAEGSSFTVTLKKGNAHLDGLPVSKSGYKMSGLMDELIDDIPPVLKEGDNAPEVAEQALLSSKKTILVVDDDPEMREYLTNLFSAHYIVYTASNGNEGLETAANQLPELVISDITMEGLNGLELCKKLKADKDLNHIPVILLTATANSEMQLQGISEGADDYITKPFDSDILIAKAERLIKSRSDLRGYFLNSITLKENNLKVPAEYQKFLKDCIDIIEENLHNKDFSRTEFSQAMGMSYRTLYSKIKMISGQSLNAFIRSVRLRRAAYLMLTENNITIAQASARVGLEDQKYFRKQFVELFGLTPSLYIKKYKGSFNKDLKIIKK